MAPPAGMSIPRLTFYPSIDVLYSVEAQFDDQGVSLGLRAREGRRGYAYITVYLLCGRSDAGVTGSPISPASGG